MQRNTRQRTAILDALGRQDDFRSAQQIHEQMRADGETVGLATVYRNLQTMAHGGQVDVLVTDDGESIYRQCAQSGHHHHLVCRECGRTVEFQAPQVEDWARRVAREHGFTDVDHTMEIFGLCPEHSSAPSDDASSSGA
ncbi:transcriptional repressor [Brachybacterium halotolerans subsp. kimchii]|uniref:Fur family transcriptional regulator n=1 Tax=Brachybacterium halotolerans TaxID=2795215 RepID=UPI001E3C7D90|nr:Fur family transcriptional regulator [Brachybacterium halotolerans]UEJ83089.1 transcriptional repressor [Brachybacterium halotolerans subsp. kimchii]